MAEEIRSKIAIDTGEAVSDVETLVSSLRDLTSELKKSNKSFNDDAKAVDADTKAKNKNAKANDDNKKSVESVLKSMTRQYISFYAVVKSVKASYEAYVELDSGIKQVESTLGSSAETVKQWAKANASAFGMSQKSAYQYAGTYSLLLSTLTKDQDQNSRATVSLLELTAVVASKTGRTVEDVANRIRSGLLGNTEAIEDLGINVNVAMLKTTDAFKKIANDRSWDKLSFQEQQQVRYMAIMEQGATKFGFTMANNVATNVQKFRAELENLKTTGGEVVGSVLTPLVKGGTQLFTVINYGLAPLNDLGEAGKGLVLTGATAVLLLPTIITRLKEMNWQMKASTSWTLLLSGALTSMLFVASLIKQKKEEKKTTESNVSEQNNETDAIKETTKAQEELNEAKGQGGLMGIDSLNSLSPISSSSLSSSSDTGASVAGYEAIDEVLKDNEELKESYDEITKSILETNSAGNTMLGIMGAIQLGIGAVTLAVKLFTASKNKQAIASAKATTATMTETATSKVHTTALYAQTTAQTALNAAKMIGMGLIGGIVGSLVTTAITASMTADVPKMAHGGVVTAPALAEIGEGRYHEAVIPLGDSREFSDMKKDIAREVARRVGGDGVKEIHTTIEVDGNVLAKSTAENVSTRNDKRGGRR